MGEFHFLFNGEVLSFSDGAPFLPFPGSIECCSGLERCEPPKQLFGVCDVVNESTSPHKDTRLFAFRDRFDGRAHVLYTCKLRRVF